MKTTSSARRIVRAKMFFGGFVILAFVAIELSFGASLLSGTTGAGRSQLEAPTVSIGDLMAPAR